MQIEEGFIKADGKRLEYRIYNPVADILTTLVLLHEGLGCIELWRDFPERLAQATNKSVLVYSRAGYANSDPVDLPRPIEFMHLEALNSLPEVFDALSIENSILVGHSDGASIALIAASASRIRDQIKGLALQAPHVFNEPLCVDSIYQAKLLYDDGDLREKLEKYHGDNVDFAFRGWNDIWLHPEFLHWNIESYLGGITCPMVVIQGKQDQYGTPKQLESIVNNISIPVETHLLEDCKHSPYRDQADKTLEIISKFVSQIAD